MQSWVLVAGLLAAAAASPALAADMDDGTIPYPVPVVLGHEGAGVIDAVGVGVTSVKEGDAVIVSTLSHCGRCAKCDTGHPTECKNAPSPKRVRARNSAASTVK